MTIRFFVFDHVLGLVDWINEDRTVTVVFNNITKDLFSKVENSAFGYKKIQPWMRNFP